VGYQAHLGFSQTKEYLAIKKQIIAESHSECAGCGVIIEEGEIAQSVIAPVDKAHRKQTKNWRLYCRLCAKVRFFDRYGVTYDGNDRMIYLPELTQAELNHLYRALKRHIIEKSQSSLEAKQRYNELLTLSEPLMQENALDLSHPGVMAFYMQNKSKQFATQVKGIRLLPGLD
jgi:hypothetical protein